MNSLCQKSDNIYNLRIFGCYGPTDAEFKLITYAIRACLQNKTIDLHQNCVFDYMYVLDLIEVLDYFINNTPKYHDYNVCTGVESDLLSICKLIKEQLDSDVDIVFEKEGYNKQYSADNSRIKDEIPNIKFTPLIDGIKKQIEWEKGVI